MSNIVVYNDGELELEVSINNDMIWLGAEDIATLFGVNRPAIVKHIGNIYKDDELSENITCSILEQVAKDGKIRKINFYNLDIIISVGYRVNSKKATKFRQWATSVLKNYIQNGYAINQHKINELRLSSLESDVETIKSHIKNNSLELKQGIFYNGQIFNAYIFVSDLIKGAKKSIILIDNYIDESTLTLFSKNSNIKIKIFTNNISKQLQLDIDKYNKQYNNLEVQVTKNFHDRFIILDENSVYHIGASLKDLGNKVFAFSKIGISCSDILKRL
jgi:prophage antirepressor-like protein